MGWATALIKKLQRDEAVTFKPRGNSMEPLVKSGQKCLVIPFNANKFKVGDIVLCKVKGSEYLHLIKAIRKGQFQIGNNKGGINGWISSNSIYGKLIRVDGRLIEKKKRSEYPICPKCSGPMAGAMMTSGAITKDGTEATGMDVVRGKELYYKSSAISIYCVSAVCEYDALLEEFPTQVPEE